MDVKILHQGKNDWVVEQIVEFQGEQFSVAVSYNIGGMNYFVGREEPRQFEIHVAPIEVSLKEGKVISWVYAAFSGLRLGILPVKRFSKKTLTRLAEEHLFPTDNETTLNLFSEVLRKQHGRG